MYTGFVIGIVALIGVILLIISLKLLGRFGWFFQWIRGTVGLVFLAALVFVVFVGLDLVTYRQILNDQAIATLTFSKIGEQEFNVEVNFVFEERVEEYTLNGDQWQMDARIIRLNGLLAVLGAKPGYRLDRLAGRYYSLEDERRKARSVYTLMESKPYVDFWSFLHKEDTNVPWIEAIYGSATFLPMADKAIFQVSLSNSGLTATPINEPAETVVNDWQ